MRIQKRLWRLPVHRIHAHRGLAWNGPVMPVRTSTFAIIGKAFAWDSCCFVRKLLYPTEEHYYAVDDLSKVDPKLEALQGFAINSGASHAKIIDPKGITIDERVQLKCRYPPCINYGKNRMCPPFTPKAREFEEIVAKYRSAMLVQVEAQLPTTVKSRIKKKGAKFTEIVKEGEFDALSARLLAGWKKFHNLITDIEREAFKNGYYLSLGLVMGNCRLCDVCDPQQPCKHPYESRPSMEAMGIDVYRTAQNSGLGFEWNNKEWIVYNGLVLIG
jgi:predicted metal-binding protein